MSKRQPAPSAGRSEKPPSGPSGRLRGLRPQSLPVPRGDRTAFSSIAGRPVRLKTRNGSCAAAGTATGAAAAAKAKAKARCMTRHTLQQAFTPPVWHSLRGRSNH